MDSNPQDELLALLPNCLRQDQRRLTMELERLQRSPRSAGEREAHWQRVLQQARRSIELRHRRHERPPALNYPESLPIMARKAEIMEALKKHPVIVVAGETGSGKTTQLPKICLEAGFGIEGKIGCTQPRRVAALSVSRRIAEELQVKWGEEVGCKIRFQDRSRPETYIKLMTDGILLAEMQGDRDLTEYEVIIVDEAHERSLNIDFILGHLRLLRSRRPDLKVIITSATIDVEAFSAAFEQAPIVKVSGRSFPVEIRYAPYDTPTAEESGDGNYIDAAVAAVEQIMAESVRGDVLVFMPSERDIRETADDLHGRYSRSAEVIPLFGRLSGGEQERAFATSQRRKIIVATNIAETSLTIPGIHYVVDAGLARMSRYSPRTRTKRLPIEPVSQSSANQRAGRSGRIAPGVCIRLYHEEDFANRPLYTQPEIQRANLAEVILRLKAWQLGEIETFPFLNPPSPQAISGGYQLLHELNALDDASQLTNLGRDLARLPVDPTIGRMVLQSAKEKCLDEVLIIAAGLSIQDPRDRPLNKQQEADQAHRRFLNPTSDFLTLLNIWRAYHQKWTELKTQSQLRRFCQAHFLSFVRMREWADVHAELGNAIHNLHHHRPGTKVNSAPSDDDLYPAIHRSILAGLLGHIAQRVETNLYRAGANRQVSVFPGSALFQRPSQGGAAAAAPKIKQPEWIMAGEIVETTRLYVRTLARIDPAWVVELGDHLCKRTYAEPRWDRSAGRVLVRERITLFGLVLREGPVDFGRVDARAASEIFIRSALVTNEIDAPHRFLKHNQELKQRVDVARTQRHGAGLPVTHEMLFAFYAARLGPASSVHDLNKFVREGLATNPNFLCATESDLTGGSDLGWDEEAFPARVALAGHAAAVTYAYARGEEHDGVTIQVPALLGHQLQRDVFDFIIPGLRDEQVEHLLKALPKSLRVPLMPIAPKVKELVGVIRAGKSFDDLRNFIRENYQVKIPLENWQRQTLPPYLRPRIALTSPAGQVVAAGREWDQLQQNLKTHETPTEQGAWQLAVQKWEHYDLRSWNFADLPDRLQLTNVGATPLWAFPGLDQEIDRVHLKLFRSRDAAEAGTRKAMVRLAELELERELAWLQKDLRVLQEVKELYATIGPSVELLETAYLNARNHLLRLPATVLPLHQATFQKMVTEARAQAGGLAAPLILAVKEILRLRQQLLLSARPYAGMKEDLTRLLPPRFLAQISFIRLRELPRYLKAMLVRQERAAVNPAKDKQKAQLVQPFIQTVQELAKPATRSATTQEAWEELRWMVEEFKVSVFAQELGTPGPISAKRLEAQAALVRERV